MRTPLPSHFLGVQDTLRIRNYKDHTRLTVKLENGTSFVYTFDHVPTVEQALAGFVRERRIKDNTRYGVYNADRGLWLDDSRTVESYDLDERVWPAGTRIRPPSSRCGH